jgi:hypothetical protein
MELTILMPCLNEARTVSQCVAQARAFIEQNGIDGEVLVADNGSTDGSQELANAAGARVVSVNRKGYGCALTGGIQAAAGRFVIMGDADQSYDFSRLEGFVEKLRAGFQLVMGNRFAGGIQKGAMPALHRYLGNPVLSFIGRLFFRARIGDFHCGLRGFDKAAMLELGLSAPGMEFASEMVVKASLAGLRIAEVPTSLAPDGRDRPPHLRTWRDGWRHLRFLLMFSPRWLFLYPGLLLVVVGLSTQLALYFGPLYLGPVGLDVHTMLFGSAATILGVQMVWLAIVTRWIGFSEGVMPGKAIVDRLLSAFSLERGLALGGVLFGAGIAMSLYTFFEWKGEDFGSLDVRHTMRLIIPAVTMLLMGGEVVVAAFLLNVIQLYRLGRMR